MIYLASLQFSWLTLNKHHDEIRADDVFWDKQTGCLLFLYFDMNKVNSYNLRFIGYMKFVLAAPPWLPILWVDSCICISIHAELHKEKKNSETQNYG